MEYSILDSRRYGLNIYRATLPCIREREILDALVSNGVDVAILRFPTSEQPTISKLDRLGMPYVVADTLVYFSADLGSLRSRSPRNPQLVFELAGTPHHQVMDSLVAEIFDNYTNHYAANPFLPTVDSLAGYCEWARGYCNDGLDGRWAWVVTDGGVPVAFLTCSEAEDGHEVEGVLFGVTPVAEGRGIYGDLIAFAQEFFKARGVSRMIVSTQVQNIPVQKAWTRAGFTPSHSYFTVHVNSFLSHSVRPVDTFAHLVTPADAQEYGQLTGDLNPLHFDNAIAQSMGFDGPISHGIIIDGLASRYFGTIWPGTGTVYLNYRYRFLKPVYQSQSYTVAITFPVIDVKHGFVRAVLRVLDDAGRLCVLSYHDLRAAPDTLGVNQDQA